MKFCAVFYITWVFSNVQAWSLSSRLQRDSVPISYNLKLIPHIKNETFDGNAFLNITEVTLDQAIRETKFHLDSELELLHVSYKDQRLVDPGEHLLNIKFRGNLQGYFGFYAIQEESNNNTRTVLATKFSPTYARRAFPCYDEPYFKSIFNIRVFKPDGSWTALSNMEEIGQVETSKGMAVDFRSTIKMSTYLLAWFLGDFKYDEIIYNGRERSIPLRFFTTKTESSDLKEALETTRENVTILRELYRNFISPFKTRYVRF
ncbi:hypothetical protein WA026_004989 [Henosepilachna vigintioctopunctata]|uniref:Aminopeptidase N-like N-terminal domain-containing protein n=1 Tax=Henosepilachna vigintioctopunctata TaxID=420089 RepID=A0AAW1UKK7_9CUCU